MQDSVLPQGCGGGVAPTLSAFISSIFYPFYPFKIPFIPLKSLSFLKKPCAKSSLFGKFWRFFRLLKTFLSYQQVINNAGFSTQVFEKISDNRSILGTFSRL